MSERRLHFEAAVPQQQLRQRRHNRALGGVIALAVLVLAAWNLSGISIAPGRLQYDTVHLGAGTEVRPVVLTNRSSGEIHPKIKVLGEAASEFSFSSEACATIKGGETCKLPVQFRPRQPGLRSAQLAVTLDEGQSATAELTGEALPAEIEFLPLALDFHEVAVGTTSVEQRVRLSGTQDFRIAAASLEGDGTLDYRVGRPVCAGNPNRGTECFIAVALQPRRVGGTTANLVVQLEGHTEPFTATLRGEGVRAPVSVSPGPVRTPIPGPSPVRTPPPQAIMRLNPLDIDFSAAPRQPQQIHIWNEGNAPLRINALLAGPDAGHFDVGQQSCAQVLPHSDCLIPVRFQPARGKPEYTAVLRLDHSAGNLGSPQEVVLHWKPAQQPRPPQANPPQPQEQPVRLVVEPSSLNFSGVTNTRTATSLSSQTVTIRNLGPGSVQNLNLRLGMFGGGENKYFHHSSNCRALGPGGVCQETVSFSATAATSYQEKLYLMDGVLKVLATVPLSATLTGPARPPAPPQSSPTTGTVGSHQPPSQGHTTGYVMLPSSPTPAPQQTQTIKVIRKLPRPTPTPTPQDIR